MKRKWMVLMAVIALAGMAGCSSEPRPGAPSAASRPVTLHEPGVYKGARDPLLAMQQQQTLIDRLRLVQSDR